MYDKILRLNELEAMTASYQSHGNQRYKWTEPLAELCTISVGFSRHIGDRNSCVNYVSITISCGYAKIEATTTAEWCKLFNLKIAYFVETGNKSSFSPVTDKTENLWYCLRFCNLYCITTNFIFICEFSFDDIYRIALLLGYMPAGVTGHQFGIM